MSTKQHPDHKPLFMLGDSATGKKVIILALPETAWAALSDEQTLDLDFSPVGIPVAMCVVKCRDHAHGIEIFNAIGKQAGLVIDDRRRQDFSIAGNNPAPKKGGES